MKKVSAIFAGILIVIAATILLNSRNEPAEKASPELLKWKDKAQIFDYKGYKISYHDSKDSSKEVVLLMHGFPTSSWDWRFVWPELQERYRSSRNARSI